MISSKKLIKMVRKWQKLTITRRRRLLLPRIIMGVEVDAFNTSMAYQGHFTVYTVDQKRFVIPLPYLNNDIFRELFNMAEEEFGLPTDGPITLPCDAWFIEYAVALIQMHAAKDLEALLLSILTTNRCLSSSSYSQQEQTNQQALICTF
ncbi:auxin-responsive protein SAUR64-like [Malania oleifera]|uniref:auxin-responsive protein SAUR64-like n=1 Tax=Malania oleifera TaxID=397392 RepID=UPI0025AE4FA3|nr:auxin-responsive protein SAUR64-like [Malania oleifera]